VAHMREHGQQPMARFMPCEEPGCRRQRRLSTTYERRYCLQHMTEHGMQVSRGKMRQMCGCIYCVRWQAVPMLQQSRCAQVSDWGCAAVWALVQLAALMRQACNRRRCVSSVA
jgi:hypothetical protein